MNSRMLNLRMALVHFLRDDGDRFRGRLQLGAIDNGLGGSATLGWRLGGMRTRRRRLDGGAGYGSGRGRGNTLHGRPVIDDGLVPDAVIVDDGSMCKDAASAIRSEAMATQVAIGEIMQSNEREVLGAETEIEAGADSRAVETPAGASIEHRVRRQGGPPAFITRRSPNHPGRSPGAIRQPDPPYAVMQLPTPIMEWCPTPGVIGLPEPAGVSVNPMSAIAVGAPGTIDGGGPRLPAPADAGQVHPRAVRRKIIVEITDVRRCILDSSDIFGGSFGGRSSRNGLRRDDGRLRLIAEGGVTIEHRADDGGRYAQVLEVQDVINRQIEGALRVLDVSEDNTFADPGTGEPNDFSGGGGKVCRRSSWLGGIRGVGGGLGWRLLPNERQSRCQN